MLPAPRRAVVTGHSSGIGLAIALKAAKDGARIVIAAKTAATNDKLPGTIYSAAAEIKAAGGEALAIQCDVRDEEQIKAAIAKAVETFGGIDIVVNNAGAIQLTNTEQTEMKRFDLMQSVNARAVFMVVKHALPYLKKSTNAHVLNLSPPLNLDADWLAPHLAYTLSKYGMSLCTLGQAAELKKFGIAVNSLWPETAIDTSAIRNLLGGDQSVQASRKPEIVADAAYWIFNQPAATCSGNFFIDSAVLTAAGETDLSKYAVDPTATLLPDFFLGKPALLHFINGPLADQVALLDKPVVSIGSVQGNDIVINDTSVSRKHIGIRKVDGGYEVADFGSTNGVFVNGERCPKKQLSIGDVIRVGNIEMVFRV